MMKRTLLLSSLLVSCLAATAQVSPKVKPEAPVAGKQYVLVNKVQNASQYMSRTSWDGALYFLGETDSNYANHAFTAVDNGDGSWSFTLPGTQKIETGELDENNEPITEEVDAPYYLILPAGAANVNMKQEVAKWILSPAENGFYQLILSDGNNTAALAQASYTPTKDIRMHLNAGGQYFCVTYIGGPFYPDVPGGIEETEDESTGDVFFAANDSASFNWGFVQVDNVPAYYADLKYSATINQFFANYCDLDDYGTGFLVTYNQAATLYDQAADLDELAEAGIEDMLNAKIDLYKAIEKAYIANDDDDAILAAAIATAKNVFDTQTATATVKAAIDTLEEAVKNHAMGNGFITSLGKNMSFEDLTSQNGAETSSVAAPPYGWNVFINGKQVTTADEVNTTIKNWHGINKDCIGDIKDGDYGFGLWVASVPSYELSQTITGLETGTYIIKAGLMVGANGNGSRRTTQRIFGNLNSTYFGAEEEYNLNLLDNQEVYGFANLIEPVTDAELQPVEVRAFVYDGTLTFGLRTDGNIAAANRTNSNSAGGDGWFKTDNYTILKVGYDVNDAIKVYNHYANILKDYALDNYPMAASLKEQLTSQVDGLSAVTSASDQADIVSGILSAKSLLAPIDASVKLYEKLLAAIEQHEVSALQYDSKPGVGEYYDAIYEATDAWEEGTAEDEAAIDSIINHLNEALQACIQSDVLNEGDDITEYIKNASFEDLSAQGNTNSGAVANAPAGWSLYVDGNPVSSVAEAGVGGWCAINSGDNIDVVNTYGETVNTQYTDGDHLWGIWSDAIPVIELSQTITGLPAGTYTVTVDAVVQNDWAGNNLGMQRLFANDYVTLYGAADDYIQNADEELYTTFPTDVRIAAEIDNLNQDADYKHLNYAGNYVNENYGASGAPYTTSLTFGLAEQGNVTIGFRSSRISAVDGQLSTQASLGWFKLDNWTLTYDSETVPAGASTTGEDTGVGSVPAAQQTSVAFYNLNGTRLAAPQKGINIVRMSNGTVSKVLVK